MATQLCQKCKQAHPGRVCDYDEQGECAETIRIEQMREEVLLLQRSLEKIELPEPTASEDGAANGINDV